MVISFQQEWVKRGCSDIGIIADAAKAGISDEIISLGKPVSTEAPKLRPRGTVRTKINVRRPAKRVRKIRIGISFWTDEPVWHIMTIRRGLRKEIPSLKRIKNRARGSMHSKKRPTDKVRYSAETMSAQKKQDI